MTYFWWFFVFYILVLCFFILWFYMVYDFLPTYMVSSGPLGVGYRAIRISDSGVWSILVVKFYIGSEFILACSRVKFTLTFPFWTLFSQYLCNRLLRKAPKTGYEYFRTHSMFHSIVLIFGKSLEYKLFMYLIVL